MNTKLVTGVAGVINAALTQNRTATGIALALDSAQLLMTPQTAAELVELRARVAELEAVSTVVFRASHDSIVMGHYANRTAARTHCETVLRREVGDSVFLGWVPDHGGDDAPEELCIGEDVECSGYCVTPIEAPAQYDAEADE